MQNQNSLNKDYNNAHQKAISKQQFIYFTIQVPIQTILYAILRNVEGIENKSVFKY